MKVLFVHQNCPGQFKHLASRSGWRWASGLVHHPKGKADPKGCEKIEYAPHRKVTSNIHPYLLGTEAAVLNGQAVARVGFALREKGYRPDVMIGNPGWGETLYLKDVWPDVPLISLCEFYYNGSGSDVGFDPEFSVGPDALLRARTRSAQHLLAIEAADLLLPDAVAKGAVSKALSSKIDVIHDGIDTNVIVPNVQATFALPDGHSLTYHDEVLTYVSRNLEPYRGFHSFMRALPAILKARPNAHVVIVGGDDVSYGAKPKDGGCWREVMLKEVGRMPGRVHFTGRIPYDSYLALLQVSSVHLYLTYPFVLSWSMLEAMASGAFVVGSDTPPVREVIEDGGKRLAR